MKRTILTLALGFAVLVLAGASVVVAQDKKGDTKTLEGTLTCTKCALKETAKCGHALIVKVDKKEMKYYLVDKGGGEPYHGQVCTEDKPAKVTGKVVEKDGKKMIESPKVEISK
jgi:uncharacterized membrane protein